MNEEGFRTWLGARGLEPTSMATRISAVRRIERVLSELGVKHAALDAAFDSDELASVREALVALKADAAGGGQRYRVLLPDSEKPLGRLDNFMAWLGNYRSFRRGEPADESDAERIRQYVLDQYIAPARERGELSISVRVGDVHDALALDRAWANVCQALERPKFQKMAEVPAPARDGPDTGANTTFTFDLGQGSLSQAEVEAELARRFGSPVKETQKIIAFRLADGRQIALDRERPPAQLWLEAGAALPDRFSAEMYDSTRPRHSNLPPRLAHTGAESRAVALVRVGSKRALDDLLDWYASATAQRDQPTGVQAGKVMPTPSSSPPPTNLIFYGPPGTGKTYATAGEAIRLCGSLVDLSDRNAVMAEYNRLTASGQIEFVTFHQSYSYEDFVERLEPATGDDSGGGFRLEARDSVFRRIATRAASSTGSAPTGVTVGGRQVFKMSIGEAADPDDAYLFDEALDTGYALLGFGDIDWSDSRFASRDAIIEAWREHEPEETPPTAKSARVQCPDMFRNWMQVGDVLVVSRGNGQFRAIGIVEGPYEYQARDDGGYRHRRRVRWLWHDARGAPVEEIYAKRFMMKTLYLLTPSDLNIPALERYMASQQPTGGEPEQFVLIIDEINRANISKVFGELITLIEPDKRLGTPGALQVRLPYSREMFGVPANLHLVGTMNTADRSIALLDTALRRRFDFRELMPDEALLEAASSATGIDLMTLLRTINQRIEYLFDREHQVGHAYFMGCEDVAAVDAVMRHKVIPLLAEYFYEDWSKVAAVLGDANGEGNFLERIALRPPAGLDADEAEPRHRWSVKSPFGERRYATFR